MLKYFADRSLERSWWIDSRVHLENLLIDSWIHIK
jgi:hypothetical protein